jgi:curved DNA-binding protein CbpA
VEPDPFTVLGLPARPEVGDDEVRAAWRRIAAATHPDRADGGDPARFAAAAAAYTTLRTRSGRGEALADLAAPRPRRGVPHADIPGRRRPLLGLARLPARVRHGRPARLALRLAVAAAVSAAAVAVDGWTPWTAGRQPPRR